MGQLNEFFTGDWIKRYRSKFTANRLLASLSLLLCLYLIWPAFNAVHLEGFTAQTESIAILKSHYSNLEHDPYLPVVSQFIYQTRTAVVDMLTAIYQVIPDAGDRAFQGLVLVSFFLLLASSLVFARRWGNISSLFAFFALVLTPGIPETAFFFNDNIISAAFATTALAVLSKDSRVISWIACGFFIAFAILSRIDAIFMAPMILGIIFFCYESRRDRINACAVIALVAFFILLFSSVYHGFSLIDAMVTAQKFVLNIQSSRQWFFVRILFFGLGTIPFLLIGGVINFRRLKEQKSYIGIATFIAYPALLAIFAPKATEIRYIFPLLAPIVATHAGLGISWVYEHCGSGSARKAFLAKGIAVFSLLVFFSPTTLVQMLDGPRSLLGRLWSPVQWTSWQESVKLGALRAKQLTALLVKSRFSVVISTHYNDEFYLRLRLIEAGFVPLLAASIYPECNGFSVFKNGDSIVAHIRTDPQYNISPVSITYNSALQISTAFACKKLQESSKFYVSTFGVNEFGISPAVYSFAPNSFSNPLDVKFADSLSQRLPKISRSYGIFNYRELSPLEIHTAIANSIHYVATSPEFDPTTGKPIAIEQYIQSYKPITGPTNRTLANIKGLLAHGGQAI